MFPGRIDLGLGRAPGGGQLEAYALQRNRKAQAVDDFPQQLAELRAFLHPERFPSDHPFRDILVAPAPDAIDAPGGPDVWLLGSSMWSANTAAAEGLPYAFAHFFSPVHTRPGHRVLPAATLSPLPDRTEPEATLAIGVICAETDAEARRLYSSVQLLQRRIRTDDRRPVATPEDALRELTPTNSPFGFAPPEEGEWPRYIVGKPDEVAAKLRTLADELHLQELIINTITHSHEARLRSYELLATEMELPRATESMLAYAAG